MKKLLLLTKTLLVVALLGMGVNGAWATATTLFYWQGASGGATITGGTVAGTVSGVADNTSVNYANSTYYTLRLNGADDYSNNYITITLDNALAAGDIIRVTGYRNKNSKDPKTGFKAKFNVGSTTIGQSGGLEFVNIDTSDESSGDSNRGDTPNTCTFVVPEDAATSTTIQLTRSITGTNLFITKLEVIRPDETNVKVLFDGSLSAPTYTAAVGELPTTGFTGSKWGSHNKLSTISGNNVLNFFNANYTIPFSGEAAQSRDIVIVSFDIALGYSTKGDDKAFEFKAKNTNNADVISETYTVRVSKNQKVNSQLGFTTSNFVMPGNANTNWSDKSTVTIVFDYEAGMITGSVVSANASTKSFVAVPVAMTSAQRVALSKLYFSTGDMSSELHTNYLDNIKVTTAHRTTTADYTIQYKCGDDVLDVSGTSLPVEGTGTQGETVTLADAAKESFWISTQKYIYVSDNASTTTLTGVSDVVTVNVRKASNFGYAFNATYGGSTIDDNFATGTVVEGEKAWARYQYYYLVGSSLVKRDYASNSFDTSFTPASDGAEQDIEYTDANIKNVVFYSEAEDIATLTAKTSGYLPQRFSGGKGAYANSEAKKITTLPRGKYKLTAHIMGTASVCTFTFKAGTETIWEHATASDNFYPGSYTFTSDEFTLEDNTNITLEPGGGDGNSTKVTNLVDYIYIQKTGEVATITADGLGYATFSSTYALDFTDVTEATAYIATAQNGDNITMKAITGTVAANTGLVLKSANGGATSFNIPIATSGTVYNTESETKNYLFAISSGYNLGTSKTGTNYVLSVQDINEVPTVVWAPIDDIAAPVTANHAALWIPATNPSRSLRMVFGDNSVTGIGDAMRLNDKGQMTNGVFNLNGQRVKKAAKGLYIVNGKKYIK